MPSRIPKPPEQRRNRNPKQQGEWIDLPVKLDAPVLPAYRPSEFTIARDFWNAWRKDPICSQYTEADIAYAVSLARDWTELLPAEQRQRAMSLGISPAGRRALRWRTQLEAEQQREAAAKIRKLRIAS